MTESMITVGCLMAEVSEAESGEITSATEGDVSMMFLFTSESAGNKIITTPEMRRLGDANYLPIAIARIDFRDPSKFVLCAINGLSKSLRSALELQGCDMVRRALNGLAGEQDVSAVSH